MDSCLAHISSFSSKEEMYKYILQCLKHHVVEILEHYRQFDNYDCRENLLQPSTVCALSNASSIIFYAMNALEGSRVSEYHGAKSEMQLDLLHLFNNVSLPKLNWVGFYFVINASFLALGPFQGKVASTQIEIGKGVCGKAVQLAAVQCVNDNHKFSGQILCPETKSEIAIPIRNQDGHVIGVLDLHSTVIGNFEDVDIRRLTEISVLLGSLLHFPGVTNTRCQELTGSFKGTLLNVTHRNAYILTASESSTVHNDVSRPIDKRLHPLKQISVCEKNEADLRVYNVSPVSSTLIPTVRMKRVGETLKIVEKRLDRIYTKEEAQEWENNYNLIYVPEILFPCNELNIYIERNKNCASHDANFYGSRGNEYIHLCINALEFMKDAKKFYLLPSYKELIESDEAFLKVPVAESWKNSRFLTHDPAIDWAFRGEYLGTLFRNVSVTMDVEEVPIFFIPISNAHHQQKHYCINYDMLKRKDLEILFYGSFDLFEDDLHDAGVSKATVKFRVMPTCLFVLLRHVVRVDMAGAICRDVRFYHEMSSSSSSASPTTNSSTQSLPYEYHSPYIIAEVSYKHIRFEGRKGAFEQNVNRNKDTSDITNSTSDFCSDNVPSSTFPESLLELSNEESALLKLPLDELVEKMTPLSVGGRCEPQLFIALLEGAELTA